MSKRKKQEKYVDDGTYVVQKSKKKSIISLILCVLVAFVIWLYATNMENKRAQSAEKNEASVTDSQTAADS